jgi:predicted ATP-dependent endonuclease of OLD family
MKLIGIRVKNYRTIDSEQYLDLKKGLTLVGPNNSGKTNILTAVRLLFTGYDNVYSYKKENDLTFGQKSLQTSLVGIFLGDRNGKDAAYYEQLRDLQSLLKIEHDSSTEKSDEIHLYLTFSASSNPSYRFYPNTKRPQDGTLKATYSRKERDLVQRLLSSFVCHYVPSNKSFEQLYEDLLTPFIKSHVASVLEDKIEAINKSLASTASNFTHTLSSSGLSDISVKFDIPNNTLSDLLSKFEFKLLDPSETSIFKKGVGIQSAAMLSSFSWITEQELITGQEVIWLIEEPEAFLHPTLNEVCKKLLYNLQERSLVIITTHSLSFVPQDPEYTAGVNLESGKTIVTRYKTYRESTAAIRNSIGVRFCDFFNFGLLNVLVEGSSDKDYLEWILNIVPKDKYEWTNLRSSDCHILDYGGVKHLSGFLRAAWEFIRNETCVVSVFDGDSAGEKERRDLQQYFGQKELPFQANEDYISVRKGFPIEALFPDEWIRDAYNSHPAWFKDYSFDASGDLESFNLKDNYKKSFANYMKEKGTTEQNLNWAKRWIDVCSTIDNALTKNKLRLSKKSDGNINAS